MRATANHLYEIFRRVARVELLSVMYIDFSDMSYLSRKI